MSEVSTLATLIPDSRRCLRWSTTSDYYNYYTMWLSGSRPSRYRRTPGATEQGTSISTPCLGIFRPQQLLTSFCAICELKPWRFGPVRTAPPTQFLERHWTFLLYMPAMTENLNLPHRYAVNFSRINKENSTPTLQTPSPLSSLTLHWHSYKVLFSKRQWIKISFESTFVFWRFSYQRPSESPLQLYTCEFLCYGMLQCRRRYWYSTWKVLPCLW